MRGDEVRVEAAFRAWLVEQGWDVSDTAPPHLRWLDVYARRDGEALCAECKGRSSDAGTDADIAYGQLLRRMDLTDSSVRYAIVVPTSSERAALRVPRAVREALRVSVYVVSGDGEVRAVDG